MSNQYNQDNQNNQNDSENERVKHSIVKETIEQCKILYCQSHLPCTKTCMCWGWECHDGWHRVLRDLSCSLEVLNILFYDKYKVRIQADQVKEKYGTLHFYYSVVCDNYTEEGLEAKKTIDAFEAKKDSGYFALKTVVDRKGYSEEVETDGKKQSIWHYPVCHLEVTAHKDEFDKMSAESDAAMKVILEKGRYDPTDEQKVIMTYMETTADRLIEEAEAKCYNTCEICGCSIGTEHSPRVETTGWIQYICKKCADKLNKPKE